MDIAPLFGKIQLLPLGLVGGVSASGSTPWKLRIGKAGSYEPLTIKQILALTDANAATYGWKYVAAAVADDSSEDYEPVSESETELAEECSGCVHDSRLASRL